MTRSLSLRPMRWLLCLVIAFCLFARPAFSQEDLTAPEDAPDEVPQNVPSQDYDEMASFRALESDQLPSNPEHLQRLTQGQGIPTQNPLTIRSQSPLDLLSSQAALASASPASFDASFAEAIQSVRRDLATLRTQPNPSQSLPFNLNCLDEPSVQEFLAIFTHSAHKTLRVWLQRAGRWRPLILSILREEGVPDDALYLAMIESGFKPRVRSPANAAGLWQFTPPTGIDQGLRIDTFVDERFDPIKSTRAAARYLKKQYSRFGSWPLAMAAYNGGSGTVSEAISAYNSNNYFSLVQHGAMFDETRRYVPKILAASLIAQNPEAFGFEGIEPHEPFTFDEIEAPPNTRLALLADAAGCSLDTLRDLNPELLLDQTPPDVASYPLRIPKNATATFVERFDDLASRYGTSHERVPLRFGQTIDMLAAEVGLPPRVIRQINGIPPKQNPPYGTALIVPLQGRSPAAKANPSSSNEPEVVLVPNIGFNLPDRQRVFYRINPGDSLLAISAHFNLRPQQVALWNDLDPAAHLRAGMTLQLFLSPTFDLSQSVTIPAAQVRPIALDSAEYKTWKNEQKQKESSGTRTYKVKAGDTVGAIAARFDVSSKDIIRWNNLDKAGTIKPGMRLAINKSASPPQKSPKKPTPPKTSKTKNPK